MPGIGASIQHYFSPKVTADTVIRQANAKGLTNAITVGPQSSSAKVTIGIMSVLTGVVTLPLFIGLYDAIQEFFFAPEKLQMLALLGTRAAHLPIDEDVFGTDTRSMTIPLADLEDNPYTTLHFIERKKADGSGETELFVKDYSGEEKPCFGQFSKLEEVQEFYKNDLAEDKEGIYSQNLSEKYLFPTLGVALYHYGSPKFDKYDLLHFEKFFGITPGTIKLEELQNPALKLKYYRDSYDFKNDMDLLLLMMAGRPNWNEWDRNSTDYLLQMVVRGLSDGMLSIYRRIFTEETLRKYVSLADTIYSLCEECVTNSPVERSFTKEFTIYGNTKVTLTNYSNTDWVPKDTSAFEKVFLRRDHELNNTRARVEVTIADKMQTTHIPIDDPNYVRFKYLTDKENYSKNYAELRGITSHGAPIPSRCPA